LWSRSSGFTTTARVVAFVVNGRAVITGALAGDAFDVVRAKCLYALEIATGERPGPAGRGEQCARLDGAAAPTSRTRIGWRDGAR
jgi:hypothetical protein